MKKKTESALPVRPRKSPTTGFKNHSRNRLGGGLGVDVAERGTRPFDADPGGRPNSKQRAAMWEGKPDPAEEAWVRRMYDVNKELIEDLSCCATIKVGGLTALTSSGDIVWQEKKGT